jgi:hypothetical protein
MSNLFLFLHHYQTPEMKNFIIASISILTWSCNSGANKTGGDSVIYSYEHIPAERKTIDPNPVKTYEETIKSFETTDEFKVSVYETKETFHYLMRIQYKSLEVEDTLKVPDFGIKPMVEIVKGDSIRPSCIVGFFDEKKQFRESKLIAFEDSKLKVKILKHYAVATYRGKAE